MSAESKKISFGFSKLVKKPAIFVQQPVEDKKVEIIDCLEGQTIKIKDAVEEVYTPLVIPIKDDKRSLLDRIKEARAKKVDKVKEESKDERPDSELTIEELAARELLKDAQKRLNNAQESESGKVVLLPEAELNLENYDKEPTLEDYENIPIGDFGLAMLRGMGWDEKAAKKNKAKEPDLRPKGLGLGATKLIKNEQKEGSTEKLTLKIGGFAKIIAGMHRGNYAEIQGFDDEGRIIVRTSLNKLVLTLNEFLVVPVTKDEYSKSSKVINNAKYEDYKEKSDRNLEELRKAQTIELSDDEEEDSELERRSLKKDKTKHRSRSPEEERRRSKKKSGKHRHRSPSSDRDHKKKSKKTKCKSRHKRSSSSDDDRKHKKR